MKGLGKGLGALIPNKPAEAAASRSSSAPASIAAEQQIDPKDQVHQVSLDLILPNPHQPRKHFDHHALEELTSSIKEHGVLQPLVVMPADAQGKHVLIAGERRLRASKLAGLKKVPAIVREASEHDKMALAIVENVQRADLNPLEEAQAYQRLMSEFNLTQEEVSKRLGKSRSTVANILRLLDLPADIQTAVSEGKLSLGHAKVLASLDSSEEQKKYAQEALSNKLSVRDLEQATRAVRKHQRTNSGMSFDPVREAQEEMLRERLGTKVQIKKTGEKGQITIHFYSREELQRLLNELT